MDRRTILAAAAATGVLLTCGPRLARAKAKPVQDDWRIFPRRGLGQLTFGLLPAEVAALKAIYGEPSRIVSTNVSANLEAVIATQGLATTLPASELALMRRLAAEASRISRQVLQGAGPVMLDYRDGRLDCVMVEPGSGPVTFADKLVFGLSAKDALVLFETANGAPGRYRSTEAAFDALAISLAGFCETSGGNLRLLSSHDEAFVARSISLRETPYQPEHEKAEFVTRSFL